MRDTPIAGRTGTEGSEWNIVGQFMMTISGQLALVTRYHTLVLQGNYHLINECGGAIFALYWLVRSSIYQRDVDRLQPTTIRLQREVLQYTAITDRDPQFAHLKHKKALAFVDSLTLYYADLRDAMRTAGLEQKMGINPKDKFIEHIQK